MLCLILSMLLYRSNKSNSSASKTFRSLLSSRNRGNHYEIELSTGFEGISANHTTKYTANHIIIYTVVILANILARKKKKLELFTWRENLYLYLKRTAILMEKFTGVFLMCVLCLLIRERKVLRTARISVMCMCSFILLNKSSQNISLSTSRI